MTIRNNLEVTTRARTPEGKGGPPSRLPALTIISHPRLQRIGQRTVLPELARSAQVVQLSRNTPDFAEPGAIWGEPLDDVFLSRGPMSLARTRGGGIEIALVQCATAVRVAGAPLLDRFELDAHAVEQGVDLELGDRVVLVLHFVEPDGERPDGSFGLVGESDAIRATRLAISRVADLDVTVLLRGESGTGKELVASAIHETGPRARGPFVAVNLSAITPSLAASELFGAVKGAYTGAVTDRKGLFASADGGTLFLDEVGDCPAEVQAMLLRALETSEICPVGSRRPQKVDVRLIAATDSNLEAKARSGVFKEPLLHRLSTYEIRMSPLRQRRDDVGRLMLHFAGEARRSLGESLPKTDGNADAPPWISADLAAQCVRYDWPGNVRQLRNLVWQLVIDGRDSDQLRIDERARRLFDGSADPTTREDRHEDPAPRQAKRRPASITEDELVEAMEKSVWNVTDAALDLGISRASLYELIKRSSSIRTAEELDEAEIRIALEANDGDVVAAAAKLRVSPRGLGRRAKRLCIES